MTSRKREAVLSFSFAGLGAIGAVVCLVLGDNVCGAILSFLTGSSALVGLLDWIDE